MCLYSKQKRLPDGFTRHDAQVNLHKDNPRFVSNIAARSSAALVLKFNARFLQYGQHTRVDYINYPSLQKGHASPLPPVLSTMLNNTVKKPTSFHTKI